jgi:PIN domain nuclease of toxin-antitoxin system
MLRAIADTHSLVWFLAADSRLSESARAVFDQAALAGELIGVSAISLVEVLYLEEKGRLPEGSLRRILDSMAQPESPLVEIPLDRNVALAMAGVSRAEVPEMPDRIIAGTALAANVPVISRDGKITLSAVPTIW